MSDWRYRFTVDHVHDGDSIYGVLDLGLGIYLGRPPKPLFGIRLAGINAPELKTPEGKRARDFLQGLVKPGDVLQVESIDWDKYGWRIDGIPWVMDPKVPGLGVNLCSEMLHGGWAAPVDYD